jgi:hypothetical protein
MNLRKNNIEYPIWCPKFEKTRELRKKYLSLSDYTDLKKNDSTDFFSFFNTSVIRVIAS